MSLFFQIILALPEILRLLGKLSDKAKRIESNYEVRLKIKDEIKVINKAIESGDASELDRLWNTSGVRPNKH